MHSRRIFEFNVLEHGLKLKKSCYKFHTYDNLSTTHCSVLFNLQLAEFVCTR